MVLSITAGGGMVLHLNPLDLSCQSNIFNQSKSTFLKVRPLHNHIRIIRLLHNIVQEATAEPNHAMTVW